MPDKVRIFAEGAVPGSRGGKASCRSDGETLVLSITPAESGKRLWIVPVKK